LVFGDFADLPSACYRDYRVERSRKQKGPVGMATLNILYGEGDADAVASLTASIQKAGHKVQSAVGRKAIQEALNKGAYDLVVLGGTLTRDDRHHLPYMVKKTKTEARVLVLHTDGSRHPAVDGFVDTGSDAEHVLQGISGFVGKPAQAKKAAAGR
jgi:DNA-binding NtrC family response regulator